MEQSLRERVDAAKKETEALREQIRALTAELDELRPQAQSYREVRSQVGDIECQARRRASELESATTMRLNALIVDVRRQYQEMSSAFSATAGQAAAEQRAKELTVQAEKDGQALLTQTRAQAAEERKRLLQTAEERAQTRCETLRADAAKQREALAREAQEHMSAAVARIVGKVVKQ